MVIACKSKHCKMVYAQKNIVKFIKYYSFQSIEEFIIIYLIKLNLFRLMIISCISFIDH